MRVHVDESGRNRQPRRVEGVMSEDRRRQETNRDNMTVANGDVRARRRRTGSIEDQAAANHDVETVRGALTDRRRGVHRCR